MTFSKKQTAGLLQKAFLASSGTWATGLNAGGTVNSEKNWWIHAELDQLTSIAAMTNVAHTRRLAQSYEFWFKSFVDHENGEVWTTLAADTNQPTGLTAKSWFWKNAFHSVEHAMFGYVTAAKLLNKPAVLYYAFSKPPAAASLRPYCFSGKLVKLVSLPVAGRGLIYRATFNDLGF